MERYKFSLFSNFYLFIYLFITYSFVLFMFNITLFIHFYLFIYFFNFFCLYLLIFTYYLLIFTYLYQICGPDSSVGVATELRAGLSGLESQ